MTLVGRAVTRGRFAAGLPILGDDMQNPAATAAPETVRELHRRLSTLMFRDQRRLQRRLDGVRKLRDPQRREAALAEIDAEVARAEARLDSRRAAVLPAESRG